MLNYKGFTLIELLITITILSIMMAIVFGGLRVGVKAWEKGEKKINSRQRVRVVLDLISQQLKSTRRYYVKEEGEKYILFTGDNKSLKFVSNLSLVPDNISGLAYANYLVKKGSDEKKEDLIFYEQGGPLINAGNEKFDTIDEESFINLFSEIRNLEFEYLKQSDDNENYEWQQSWDAQEERSLPKAIKIEFKEADQENCITVIIPILLETAK